MKILLTVVLAAALAGIVAAPAFAEGETEVKAQTKCPVMGGDIDKQYFADYNGKRVYFCCPMCAPQFNKDPEKYIKKLEDEGVTLEKTPAAPEAPVVAQTKCPITGNAIDKQYFADRNGKRVYFCCPNCAAEFNKDPDKYVKQLEDAGVTLENAPVAQTTCPNSGKPIDKNYFADYNGKRVYFCGPGCVKAFKADPEPYMQKLEAAGITLEDAPVAAKAQTMCPVLTGNKINKNIFADYEGKRVYFCCRACQRTFKKNPAKYVKKLEDEGITLEKVPGSS
jgi:YHS domain-containing protein